MGALSEIVPIVADLSRAEDICRLVSEAVERFGRIDILVTNAGGPPVAGFLDLTKVLANRYGQEGILFNSVAPGFILTGRQEEILQARSREMGITRHEYLEHTAGSIPMKRLGRPEELADAIVFLCSERASYIQGATLSVDGGLTRGLL